jgi:asparagine synthetase B (glutamine-hydrolysing)
MFLFVSDVRLLRISIPIPSAWGRSQIRQLGNAKLIWIDDGFSTLSAKNDTWEVDYRLDSGIVAPICGFHWCSLSSTMKLYRRWSGEFCLYYHRQDGLLCAASHLKLLTVLGQPFRARAARLEANFAITLKFAGDVWIGRERKVASFHSRYMYGLGTAASKVQTLLLASVDKLPADSALLLSGGIDSSAIAAAATIQRKAWCAYTFHTAKDVDARGALRSDRLCAREVARHLGLWHREIFIPPERLVANVPLSIFLSETHRGTAIDECTALIEVARHIHRAGHRHVVVGETADDLFGSFNFVLRYYRGQQLRKYYRRELSEVLPNSLALIQNVFRPWGISVIDPFWTEDLMRIGYNLPLRHRIDRGRLMKPVLREAFSQYLPDRIVSRPKCITRDATGIRAALEARFGNDRDRYRPIQHELYEASSKSSRFYKTIWTKSPEVASRRPV